MENNKSDNSYDVIIVGAGASGLATGRKLLDSKCFPYNEILILEARDRIGGRIHTDYSCKFESFSGNSGDQASKKFALELGAEFIHGENASTHELVKQAGMHVIEVSHTLSWADAQGKLIPFDKLDINISTMINKIEECWDEIKDWDFGSADCSVAEYFRVRGLSEEYINVSDVIFGQSWCAKITNLSARDIQEEMKCSVAGKKLYRIVEGYSALIDFYSQDLQIKFNSVVQSINWIKHGDKIEIITNKGDTLSAKYCVLTVPVIVLQRDDILFTPLLSKEKRNAIKGFAMENATKLIYQFREKLWDDNFSFIGVDSIYSTWWAPSLGQENFFPNLNFITLFLTAERAKIIDSMSEDQALKNGLVALAQLLNISFETAQQSCIRQLRVSWGSRPYSLGGYSTVLPTNHQPSEISIRHLLAKSEWQNKLHFAGEATAFDSNPQTVHGAFDSGWRVAENILELEKVNKLQIK